MKLRFTRRAVQDLEQIGDYVRNHNPDAALRVRGAILESLKTLLLFPHAGRKQTVEGVRKFVTHRYPCIVYYSMDAGADEPTVLTIQPPARGRPFDDV